MRAKTFGYILNRNYWNNGYMTEAVRAIVKWASEQPNVNHIEAEAEENNQEEEHENENTNPGGGESGSTEGGEGESQPAPDEEEHDPNIGEQFQEGEILIEDANGNPVNNQTEENTQAAEETADAE